MGFIFGFATEVQQVYRLSMANQPKTMTTFAILSRLLRETVPLHKGLYAFILISSIGVSVFTAGQAYSTKLIVNDVFGDEPDFSILQVVGFVILIFLGKAVSLYANQVLGIIFHRSIGARYQKKLFEVSLRQTIEFFNEHPANLMARTALSGRSAGAATVAISNKMLTDALTLLALTFVMVSQTPFLSSLVLILVPFIYLIIRYLTYRIRNLAQDEAAMDGAIYSLGSETFQGIKTVKSFGLENKAMSRFDGALMTMQTRMQRIAQITGATIPLMELLSGLALAAFVLYVGGNVTDTSINVGAYTAFMTAFLMAYAPAQRLAGIWVKLQRRIPILKKMFELLDQPAGDIKTKSGNPPKTGRLNLSELEFSYLDLPAINKVDAIFLPGDRIGIVGASGAGKSTLIDLVMGFVVPTKGQVILDEQDLRSVELAEKIEVEAYTSQEVFLFDGTIRDNIRDGNPNATDAQIEEAAGKATVLDFVDKLPNGIDTEIGPNGSNLSGGQKQRVGIARALIKPAKIFIYDEATSALDGETEQRVMQAIRDTAPDSVVLFVTHRASTLDWMDKVLVLDEGRVVAFDTVENVRATSDHFKAIFAPAPAA